MPQDKVFSAQYSSPSAGFFSSTSTSQLFSFSAFSQVRSAILFLIAILTPCAVLGWVSWRSMKKEEGEIQRQRTAFYQQAADNAARAAGVFMTEQLRSFGETVDRLLASDSPDEMRLRFHQAIRGAWPLAEAGLVLDATTGRILPQVEPSEQAVTSFVERHAWFFRTGMQPLYLETPPNEMPALATKAKIVRWDRNSPAEPNTVTAALDDLAKDAADKKETPHRTAGLSPSGEDAVATAAAPRPALAPVTSPAAPAATEEVVNELAEDRPANAHGLAPEPVQRREQGNESPARRLVSPQYAAPPEPGSPSLVKPVLTSLSSLVSIHETGMASHPGDEGLFTLFWYRPPAWPQMTFAAALQPEALKSALAGIPAVDTPDDDTCLALLDHRLQPAAMWTRGSDFHAASWNVPLVAREIGASLPGWEASVFLRNPAVFANAASAARWSLGIIVTTASLAALTGAFFILRDARRAALDARQKTDFVSNVSHELKTPLTSIRMFSDLLADNPGAPSDKLRRYAEVIASEAARLTRLINNVLNFSRMERGNTGLQKVPLDFRALAAETIEHVRPQLEKSGFTIEIELPGHPVLVCGDSDALSQVLLNLLSNAEKYGTAPGRPCSLAVSLTENGGRVMLRVADCGPGVPRGHERRIFERFHRAHDTLASGTAGSGLGLTIARRLAEAHGGSLEYAPRDGGGAVFILTLEGMHGAQCAVSAALFADPPLEEKSRHPNHKSPVADHT